MIRWPALPTVMRDILWIGAASIVAACTAAPPGATEIAAVSAAASASAAAERSDGAVTATALATAPTTTATPQSPRVAEPIEMDDLVEVVVDRLNLREDPSTSGESIGRLPRGSAGIIVGGPVVGDDYSWYAVVGTGLPYGSGCVAPPSPEILNCPNWSGWVASADADGKPWIEKQELTCGKQPETLIELVHLEPADRLLCLRGETLTFDAYISPVPGGRGCFITYEVSPSWLHPCAVGFLQGTESEVEAAGPELVVHVHPSIATGCAGEAQFGRLCPLNDYVGQWIEVDGHYDDPAASTCIATPIDVEDAARPWSPDSEFVEHRCREAFVLTAVRSRP